VRRSRVPDGGDEFVVVLPSVPERQPYPGGGHDPRARGATLLDFKAITALTDAIGESIVSATTETPRK